MVRAVRQFHEWSMGGPVYAWIIQTTWVRALYIHVHTADSVHGIAYGIVIDERVVIDGEVEVLMNDLLKHAHASAGIAWGAEMARLAVDIGFVDLCMSISGYLYP